MAELPRAFVVSDAVIIPEPTRVLDRMTSRDFDPTRSVILEEEPARLPPDGSTPLRSDIQFEPTRPNEVDAAGEHVGVWVRE